LAAPDAMTYLPVLTTAAFHGYLGEVIPEQGILVFGRCVLGATTLQKNEYKRTQF
jgi:hypothetical protein